LEPGKKAYLVVVDGAPLEDIEALREVRLVLLDGVEAAQKNLPVHYFLGFRNETNRALTNGRSRKIYFLPLSSRQIAGRTLTG